MQNKSSRKQVVKNKGCGSGFSADQNRVNLCNLCSSPLRDILKSKARWLFVVRDLMAIFIGNEREILRGPFFI
jgi:hypothetical protein